ncbi:MAG: hypothetical protein ABI413_04665 [Ktedonobacteraceae bacterium]
MVASTSVPQPGQVAPTLACVRQATHRTWRTGVGFWLFGLAGLLLLLSIGWYLPGIFVTSAYAAPVLAQPLAQPISVSAISVDGSGAGGVPVMQVTHPLSPAFPADFCLPTDATCWMQSASQWAAQQIQNPLQSLVALFLNNPVDLLFQTPPADTYQNPTVIALWNALMDAVNAALACVIVIGGYNAIVAPYLSLRQSSIAAFLPQLLLAFAAAHFSLTFLGLFIDLENALCVAIITAAGITTFANAVLGVFQNPTNEGLLLWLLVIVIAIMIICLVGQMILRIGLVVLLLVLSGPALLCFGLPQTQRYARLWMTLFTSTVLVQFFQVTALSLGGMLLTSVGTTDLLHVPQSIAQALLCIGVLFLVLKIPGMLNTWALRSIQEGFGSAGGGGSSGGGAEAMQGFAQDQAARQESIEALAALL